MSAQWLTWIQELQAIAQNGLRYSQDPFDLERFKRLRAICSQMLAALSEAPPRKIQALFDGYEGTATPKIDVRGVVLEGGGVLLVREKSDARWTLPGGWANVGESLAKAVEKEVREESGYIVKPVRLLAVQDRPRHNQPPIPEHTWKIFVHCETVRQGVPDELETDAVGFFRLDDLPPLSEGRVTRAQLERMVQLCADPDAPADFD